MTGNILDQPVLTISLDLELAWGFILYPHDEVLALLQSDTQKARETIDILLKLFERYDISATWAVVGHLFLDSDNKEKLIYEEMPQFTERWIDWRHYLGLRNNPLYYGKDIVERILASSVGHEIGLHGFFHMPFHQCSREVAEEEIELGMKLAGRFGVKPVSFVFPGNNIGHLDVLRNYGFQIYRGKTPGQYDKTESFPVRKLNSVKNKLITDLALPLWKDGIWELPGSTYFCDQHFPFTLLPRAKLGLERAIRTNKIFHIWLHPWSLLLYKQLVKDLEKFLDIVAQKRDKGKLDVMTMGRLASQLNERS